MKEPSFGELVVHPAPLNVFTSLMIPFVPFNVKSKRSDKYLMETISLAFSKGVFWVENIPFVVLFITMEIAIFPLVMLKSFCNFVMFTKKIEVKRGILYVF
jgi:hypothetical protein